MHLNVFIQLLNNCNIEGIMIEVRAKQLKNEILQLPIKQTVTRKFMDESERLLYYCNFSLFFLFEFYCIDVFFVLVLRFWETCKFHKVGYHKTWFSILWVRRKETFLFYIMECPMFEPDDCMSFWIFWAIFTITLVTILGIQFNWNMKTCFEGNCSRKTSKVWHCTSYSVVSALVK